VSMSNFCVQERVAHGAQEESFNKHEHEGEPPHGEHDESRRGEVPTKEHGCDEHGNACGAGKKQTPGFIPCFAWS